MGNHLLPFLGSSREISKIGLCACAIRMNGLDDALQHKTASNLHSFLSRDPLKRRQSFFLLKKKNTPFALLNVDSGEKHTRPLSGDTICPMCRGSQRLFRYHLGPIKEG